jgi:type VI secretion system secreted protein Hcp
LQSHPQADASLRIGKGYHERGDPVRRKATGDGSQQDYMTWTIKPLIVSSYHSGGSSGAEIPVDSVSLNYGAISVEYKTQSDAQGSLTTAGTFKWDVKQNKEA